MGVLGFLGKGAYNTATAIGRGFVQLHKADPVTRNVAYGVTQMGLGGTIGGITGYATSDSNTTTGDISSAISGAMYGATVGFSLRAAVVGGGRAGKWAVRSANRYISNPAELEDSLSAAVPGAIKIGEDIGAGIWNKAIRPMGRGLRWASMNPGTTVIGLGTVGIGGMAAYDEFLADEQSPTMSGARVDAKYNLQAQALEEMQMNDITPSGRVSLPGQGTGMGNQRLAQSTQGLVQGMHRGRHGGY